jgi:multicomponent Na+:H+ antiporter subunit G
VIDAFVVPVLLGVAVAVALLSALGMALMRDPYQKLHYIAPPASLSAICIAVALFLSEKQKLAAGKGLLIAVLLYFMNAVITHATARAHYVRQEGGWPPREDIEVVRE